MSDPIRKIAKRISPSADRSVIRTPLESKGERGRGVEEYSAFKMIKTLFEVAKITFVVYAVNASVFLYFYFHHHFYASMSVGLPTALLPQYYEYPYCT